MNIETANFLQSTAWAKVNELIGHKVITEEFAGKTTVMIIKNAKRGRYMEIPGGPTIDWQNTKLVKETFARIHEIANQNHCVFVRIRPQLLKNDKNLALLQKIGLKPATMHLAAEHTVIIDLEKSEEELLANMRRQTRYEVRRSEKLGITVSFDNSEAIFKEFHKVQADTATRQHFIPPDLKTLLAEREAFGDNARIYVATAENGPRIAYGLVLIDGDEAAYYEAASTELNHKLPGAYALQWQIMRDLRALGIKRYNLWGIAPPNQPNHRYAGVTTFKTGFGGEIVEFVPAHDLIISKIKYLPNYAIEKVRKKWRHL